MMRRVLLPLLACAIAASCASAPAIPRNPFTADQIARLVRGAVSPDRILYDAARECIAFRITSDVRDLLADAGAPPSLADSLQTVCYMPPAAESRAAAGSPGVAMEPPGQALSGADIEGDGSR